MGGQSCSDWHLRGIKRQRWTRQSYPWPLSSLPQATLQKLELNRVVLIAEKTHTKQHHHHSGIIERSFRRRATYMLWGKGTAESQVHSKQLSNVFLTQITKLISTFQPGNKIHWFQQHLPPSKYGQDLHHKDRILSHIISKHAPLKKNYHTRHRMAGTQMTTDLELVN